MKTLLVGLASAFLALILAWGLIVLFRPETGIESALAVLEIAFAWRCCRRIVVMEATEAGTTDRVTTNR